MVCFNGEWIGNVSRCIIPAKPVSTWVVTRPQTSCYAACEEYGLGCSVQEMRNINDSITFADAVAPAFPGYVASCVFFVGETASQVSSCACEHASFPDQNHRCSSHLFFFCLPCVCRTTLG